MAHCISYSTFEFDDLDLIMPPGWRIRSGFEGRAIVDVNGEIVDVTVRAYKNGDTDQLSILPEDGPLLAWLIAALKDQYASSIAEATEAAQRQAETRPAYSYAG